MLGRRDATERFARMWQVVYDSNREVLMMNIGVMIAATAESGDIATIAREAENLGYESFLFLSIR